MAGGDGRLHHALAMAGCPATGQRGRHVAAEQRDRYSYRAGHARMSRAWLAGGAALVAAMSALGTGGPPVYDGIGQPDEPYRYVAPPPGYRHTPPATSAGAAVPLYKGLSGNA